MKMAEIILSITGPEDIHELLAQCQTISATDTVILNGLDNVDTQTAIMILKALPENLRALALDRLDFEVDIEMTEQLKQAGHNMKFYRSRDFENVKAIFANFPKGLQALSLKSNLMDQEVTMKDGLKPEEILQLCINSRSELSELLPKSLKVLDLNVNSIYTHEEDDPASPFSLNNVLPKLIAGKKLPELRVLRIHCSALADEGFLPRVTDLIQKLEASLKDSDPARKLTCYIKSTYPTGPSNIEERKTQSDNFQKAVSESVRVQLKFEALEKFDRIRQLEDVQRQEKLLLLGNEVVQYLNLIEEHLRTAKGTQQIALLEDLPPEIKREILRQYNQQSRKDLTAADPTGPKRDPDTLDVLLDKLKKSSPN